MKILSLSDIHGKIDPVHRLRALEDNSFDAIIVAGDIGHGLPSAVEVFCILSSFNCPILYVYGNWDYSLYYDHEFDKNAHHLHNACFCLEKFAFAGFSGVPANWGKNPWVNPIMDAILARQSIPLDSINSEVSAAEKELDSVLAEKAETLPEHIGDLPARLKAKRQRLNVLRGRRTRLIKTQQEELSDSDKHIIEANRKDMLARMAPYEQNNTIVVTHERLTNTFQDMPRVPLFLFGHRHGHTNTWIKQSNFVNVSALDHVVPVIPEHSDGESWKDYKGSNIGAYTTIEFMRGGEIRTVSHPLYIMPPGWKRVRGSAYGLPPLCQEDVAPNRSCVT